MNLTNMWNKIVELIKGKKVPDYPSEFVIIDYSPIAKNRGVVDDQNKLIYKFSFNNYGFREINKFPFNEAHINILKKVYNLPVYDKTQKQEILPIFAKILPSELEFKG